MKDMTVIKLDAFLRYSNHWHKIDNKCQEAMAANDWDAAGRYIRLMNITNNLCKF